MQVHVFDAQGNPATCYRCGKPATGYFNLAFNLASGAADDMEPVCDEHMPLRLNVTTHYTALRSIVDRLAELDIQTTSLAQFQALQQEARRVLGLSTD